MNTEALVIKLEADFPFVDKPVDRSICFHTDECYQCSYLIDDLLIYKGREIPPQAIRCVHQEMSCLSAKGWRWVLPSYLRYCLTDEARYNEMETEFLIYNLAPSDEYKADTLQRLSGLNKSQINCLIEFLNWCKQQESWKDYCLEEIEQGIIFLSSIKL